MSDYTVDTLGPRIVVPGGASIKDNTYFGDGSTTFAKGDMVRVNTSGQIVDAAVDSDTTGPVHGMVLDDWATAPATDATVAIVEFASDTILEMQLYAAAAADAEPEDVAIGTSVELRNSAAGLWCATVTTAKGIALIVDKVYLDKWFEDAKGDNYGLVLVRFSQANLDAHGG